MASYVFSDFNIEMPRQADGDIEMEVDLDAIKNSIHNILATFKGSRRMLPEFGSALERILFEPLDNITAYKIGNEMLAAIEKWDDRVEIKGINIDVDYDASRYDVMMEFQVKGLNLKSLGELRLILKRL